MYEDKISQKEMEIQSFSELKGKELFNKFTMDEKINNIRLSDKSKKMNSNLSTNENSI